MAAFFLCASRLRSPRQRSACRYLRAVWMAGWAVLLATTARAQDLVSHALATLPADTVRVEYFSPAKLRALPEYPRLRDHFVGPRLRLLEQSFSQLGIGEESVDEMILAWLGSPRVNKAMGGLALGRFDKAQTAAAAAQAKVLPSLIADWQAYCVGVETSCVVILDGRIAVFGSVDFLRAMRGARDGRVPNLLSNPHLMNLIGQIRSQPPIWGIATGDSVIDWFEVWLAGPSGAAIDWTPLFESVEDLMFYADLDDKVGLHLNLDFSSSEAANRLRQTLEMLMQLQQVAWRNQAPGRPNPLDRVKLDGADRSISLTATADYSQLEEGIPFSNLD